MAADPEAWVGGRNAELYRGRTGDTTQLFPVASPPAAERPHPVQPPAPPPVERAPEPPPPVPGAVRGPGAAVVVLVASVAAVALAVLVATAPEGSWSNTISLGRDLAQIAWTCILFGGAGAAVWYSVAKCCTVGARLSGLCWTIVSAILFAGLAVVAIAFAMQSATWLGPAISRLADLLGVHALHATGAQMLQATGELTHTLVAPLRATGPLVTLVGWLGRRAVSLRQLGRPSEAERAAEARALLEEWIELVRPTVVTARAKHGSTPETIFQSIVNLFGEPPSRADIAGAAADAVLAYAREQLFGPNPPP